MLQKQCKFSESASNVKLKQGIVQNVFDSMSLETTSLPFNKLQIYLWKNLANTLKAINQSFVQLSGKIHF